MASITFTLEDGTTFTTALEKDLITIGRHNESMVQLASPSVSSHHGALRRREDGFYVQDIGSRNGTRVNGVEIEEAKLNDGDRLLFGDVQAIYLEDDSAQAALAAAVAAPVAPTPAPAAPAFLPAATVFAPPATPQPPRNMPVGAPRHRITPVRRSAPIEETGGGCMLAVILAVVFLCAFLIGLFWRHYNETSGFLPTDLLQRMPKVKIEQSSGS